jgi:hypothetical protein
MPQYVDHIKPVAISFAGLSISAVINIVNICCHHDRPFQLLSTRSVRLNIILPILSPFILIGEAILFMFFSHFEIPVFSESVLLQNTVFLCIPIIPLALSAFASAANVKIASPGSRESLVHPFARRVNTDEEMLLDARREGVPEVLGDTYGEGQAKAMIETHYTGVFWTEFACLVIDVAFAMPWVLHVLGW